jgi:hypothetical protein
MKSECFCLGHSCESLTVRNPNAIGVEDAYITSTGMRFQFNKDERGVIQSGGMVMPDIPHCRELHQGEWVSSLIALKEKLKEPHLSNKERRKMERAKKFGRV